MPRIRIMNCEGFLLAECVYDERFKVKNTIGNIKRGERVVLKTRLSIRVSDVYFHVLVDDDYTHTRAIAAQ